MAGMIPTPFPSPVIFRSSDGFSEQLENVLKSLDCHCPIITDIDLGDFLEDLDPKLLLRHPQWNISKIKESWDELPKIEKYNLQDIALVQYTSGSTSFPKGVVVGQKEILANIEAIIRSVNVTSNDFNVTWGGVIIGRTRKKGVFYYRIKFTLFGDDDTKQFNELQKALRTKSAKPKSLGV